MSSKNFAWYIGALANVSWIWVFLGALGLEWLLPSLLFRLTPFKIAEFVSLTLAQKKWLEAKLQEKKSSLFNLKQQLDKCEQDIEDIKEGKMKKIQYSMICNAEDIKEIMSELHTVLIQ